MLTDPGFAKPEPVGQGDLIEVPIVGVGERPIGRVQRHHEQAEVHPTWGAPGAPQSPLGGSGRPGKAVAPLEIARLIYPSFLCTNSLMRSSARSDAGEPALRMMKPWPSPWNSSRSTSPPALR